MPVEVRQSAANARIDIITPRCRKNERDASSTDTLLNPYRIAATAIVRPVSGPRFCPQADTPVIYSQKHLEHDRQIRLCREGATT
jgi:hypothetical protein